MAVFGRRQPHAPIILKGGGLSLPVARAYLVLDHFTGSAAYRGRGRVIIKTVGPLPSVARSLVRLDRQTNDRHWRAVARRVFKNIPPPQPTPQPPVGSMFLVTKLAQQAALQARRPLFQPKALTIPIPAVVPVIKWYIKT